MTLSLVARVRDPRLFGLIIASSSPAVAARCAHARAGVGAVASQNITDPALGPAVLDALAAGGLEAGRAIERALSTSRFGAYRQLLAIGAHGPPAVHSGVNTLGRHAQATGADAAAAGNLLAAERVPQAMLGHFEAAAPPAPAPASAPAAPASAPAAAVAFGERLLGALRAGVEQGGEAGPLHSAGLLIVREVSWPIVDLRVDWSDEPVSALEALWARYAPQIEDYVVRALDPARAPSFAVAGDR